MNKRKLKLIFTALLLALLLIFPSAAYAFAGGGGHGGGGGFHGGGTYFHVGGTYTHNLPYTSSNPSDTLPSSGKPGWGTVLTLLGSAVVIIGFIAAFGRTSRKELKILRLNNLEQKRKL